MDKSTIKRKSIIAMLWDMAGNFSLQFIQFVNSVILARLLSPSDFGLVGMALVFIYISQAFVDFGFGTALIQNKVNTELTYSTVFIVNIFCGVILTSLFCLFADSIGVFYGNSDVGILIYWLAPSLVFSALSIVQISILKRELKFKELNVRLILANICSGAIGISLAFLGYGANSLAIAFLCNSIVNMLALWHISDWKPSLGFSKMELKSLWSFSSYVFLSRFLNIVVNRLDALVIGKLFSPALLGFYTRAESLNHTIVSFSSGSLSKVYFSAMSRIQDDLERFRQIFIRILSLVSLLAFFFAGILILSSDLIIIGLFGEKWEPSIIIFKILLLKIFCYPISVIVVNSFNAIGLAKENFWFGLVRKVLVLIPFGVAYIYGFNAFLYCLVAVTILGTFFNHVISHYYLKVSLFEQLTKVYKFAVFAIIAYFSSIYMFGHMGNLSILALALKVALYVGIFLTLFWTLDKPMKEYLIANIKQAQNYFTSRN